MKHFHTTAGTAPGSTIAPGTAVASRTVVACRLEELPPGEAYRIDGDTPIAVFNADGDLYAVDDTCTHQDASLADGWLEGCTIECPLHASCFDLRTGKPSSPPAKEPLRTYRVTLADGLIHVYLPDAG